MDPTDLSAFEPCGPDCTCTDGDEIDGAAETMTAENTATPPGMSIGQMMSEFGSRIRADHERAEARGAAVALARGFQFFGEAAAIAAAFVAETLSPVCEA